MNKYMGFYELKKINIPTVPWKQFTYDEKLDESLLWTLRVAVENNNDLNLPRIIGENSAEAERKGKELLDRYVNGIVIYYPFFIAEKSGVVEVKSDEIIIEAVDKDLWNLVTYGKRNVTITINSENTKYDGDEGFLTENEILELRKNCDVIKARFRNILSQGNSVMAEWSFAYKSDTKHNPVGDRYLVFYELRSIE